MQPTSTPLEASSSPAPSTRASDELPIGGSPCLALSTLCENPQRRTGLTTYFHGLVNNALKLYPNIRWLIFAGQTEDWPEDDERVRIVRRFPANDRLLPRLWADHVKVPAVAKQMGADALLTVGFVPVRKMLPTVMSLFSLQHADPSNRIGGARQVYRRFMTRSGIARADLLITNSACAASQIKAAFPRFGGKLIVSHEGLQTDQFLSEKKLGEDAELKTQFGIEPGFFLWVSNFYPYKQVELLLEGYSRVDAALRATHPLVMVGGGWNGGDSSALARARALGIEANVRFLGWVEERWLAPLYRNAIAFCLASREETFGRIVIEAMACGTPCVVNDIPIMHEVTAGHALIVDFQNRNVTANALNRIVLDRDLHGRLRSEGLRRAADFSFEKMTRERIDAILELLGKVKS
jgi:glycosyltransferase involved in cell wall biosynthesis